MNKRLIGFIALGLILGAFAFGLIRGADFGEAGANDSESSVSGNEEGAELDHVTYEPSASSERVQVVSYRIDTPD